ncbi:T9SS type A sorting domain-containing protein [Altibacter sp.]|mgnify:CR=1 FL=1|uniref:T9SS type A sorting domain-containing protein n=1 Tax=Altibacter sp. TaxID=2024823 RepID=UPI000C9888D5|nr:T9SS type A sorting domain-containing protein [Altibacter sp.]MAP55231.1 hypothetical protein [Altibacter sp.]
MKYASFLTLILGLTLLSTAAGQNAGYLDVTFGDFGIAPYTDNNDHRNEFCGVRSDGSIISGGGNWGAGYMITCYNPNGTIDESFGQQGAAQTIFLGNEGSGTAVAFSASGEIYVAGTAGYGSSGVPYSRRMTVSKFTNNGAIPDDWGNGTKTIDYGTSADTGSDILIQPDGKIVVVGSSYNGNNADFAIARLHPDGSYDTTFNGSGRVRTDIANNVDGAYSVSLFENGKLLLVGITLTSQPQQKNLAMVLYNANGTIDTTFGVEGKVIMPIGTELLVYDAEIDMEGRILIVGEAFDGNTQNMFITRYLPNGILDTTFAEEGIYFKPLLNENDSVGYNVAIQSDGKILVGGQIYIDGRNYLLCRFSEDGVPDDTFGEGGFSVGNLEGGFFRLKGMDLQEDGKIIVSGNGSFALMRFLAESQGTVIEEPGDDTKISVYPNPLQSEAVVNFKFRGTRAITLALYDIFGHPVDVFLSNEVRNLGVYHERIFINGNVPPGIYFLILSDEKEILSSHKIIKQ